MQPKEYEEFVAAVCRELLSCDGVKVFRDKEFVGRVSHRTIKADVSFEMSVLGTNVLFIAECKCYKSRVHVGEVEEFNSKLQDIGGHKGIMFTTVGYQTGAVKAARGFGIALAQLSPQPGQGEMVIVLKRYNPQAKREEDGLLRGNIKPWGRFSAEKYAEGFRFESAGEMLRAIAYGLFDEVPWQNASEGGEPVRRW